jgi:hypothetical protein
MTYPFVKAYAQYGRRKGPVKAFVVHMAEGGNTVAYLAKANPRNVSVHYVIERTGRIVQMVPESDASGSINPNDLRLTDDSDGFYGVTAAKAVMGEWWRDPNAAAITLEIEGFAAYGPNAAQSASLRVLVDDVRSRFPSMGLLGHRDFTSRKACPGKLIHWDELGGHGPAEEEQLRSFTYTDEAASGWYTVSGDDHLYLRLRTNTLHPIGDGVRKRAFGPVTLTDGGITGPADPRKVGYLINGEAAFMLNTDGVFLGDAPPAVVPDVVLSPGQLFTVGAK